ncbi:MAG TPA: iron-sulfur cluster carrier protein ApbC [Blastocatellia bacterium]|nr:iron-sulfur cluster carrier protein ApbC [Blastocatellia bacterium]
MAGMNIEQVLKALRTVKDPWLNRDIVALDFVRDLDADNNAVRFKLILNRPSPSAQALLEQAARDAILSLGGSPPVEIETGWEVTAGKSAEGKQSVPGVKNIIAVSSGKGGVGKSTVAVNLAVALAQAGAQVGLLDTDVYGPNVPIMVGVNEQPRVHGQMLLPNTAHGIKVMSLGFLNPGDRPVVWRGPMLHTAVRQFLYDVEWGELDYLIVDMPPGTGDAQLSLAQLVPVQGAVVVTTPQEVAMADVRKAINMFEQVHIPVLGVVENMSYFVCENCSTRHAIFGTGGGAELAGRFNVSLLGQVPLSVAVREGGDAGVPIVVGAPDSLQAAAFREIAEHVATQISLQAIKGAGLPVINLSDNRGDRFAV